MKKRLIIKNEISEISRLNQFVEECGQEFGISPGLAMSLNLALEEAVSNVILYATDQKDCHCGLDPQSPAINRGSRIESGMTHFHNIRIDAEKENDSLVFTIIDKGMEFDPTQQEDIDVSLSVEDRPIGGLGIFLIKKIMDEVNYQRIDGQNILTLRKKINNQTT